MPRYVSKLIIQMLFIFSILFPILGLSAPHQTIPQSRCVSKWCYGIDIPNGLGAVRYIYGPEGTWKHIQGLQYHYNYYEGCGHSGDGHPYNRVALLNRANGSAAYTAADADCHLLFHSTGDAIQIAVDAHAFEEHNGRGRDGVTKGSAFSNFWYDDNWLAHYMSAAYSRPLPQGLVPYGGFTRWKIVGGDTRGWRLYSHPEHAVDLLALNGLYYMASNQSFNAFLRLNTIISLAGAKYNTHTRQYDFPNLRDVYYYGLTLILATKIMDDSHFPENVHTALLPYWLSLRAHLIQMQQKQNQQWIGWVSGLSEGGLINTETVASSVLGLSADSLYTFEANGLVVPGSDANLNNDNNTVVAVPGVTHVGTIAQTQAVPFVEGRRPQYKVTFYLRGTAARLTGAPVGTLNIINAKGQTVVSQPILLNNTDRKTWTEQSLLIPVHSNESFSFSVQWSGYNNLEVGLIRVI